MAAAYKAINAVISQLKQCFADNEEAKAEIANLLNKVLEDCIIFRNVSRNVRILFYKLDEPLDALRDAWESRVCDIQKTIDMESDAWNSSKEELFYVFRVIGYMVQGYLRKVKRKVGATIY